MINNVEKLIEYIKEDKLDRNMYYNILSTNIVPFDVLKVIKKEHIIDFYPKLTIEDIVDLELDKISNTQVRYLMELYDDPISLLKDYDIEHDIHHFLFYERYRTPEFIKKNIGKLNFSFIIDEKCNDILDDDIIRQNLNLIDWKLLTVNYIFSDSFALEVLNYIYIPLVNLMQVSKEFYDTHLAHRFEEYQTYGKTQKVVEKEINPEYIELLKDMGYLNNPFEQTIKNN